MENLRWLVEHFQNEWGLIRAAPVTYVLTALILAVVIIGGVEWHSYGTNSAQVTTRESQCADWIESDMGVAARRRYLDVGNGSALYWCEQGSQTYYYFVQQKEQIPRL
jgi:hypothetical protein